MYRPNIPFVTAAYILIPTTINDKGVVTKVFPKTGRFIFCNFKTYGGTEKNVNGIYSIEDTATVETWFDPLIKSDCRFVLADTGATYEIINEPENIDMRNQFLKFKIRRIKGGV